MTHPRPGAVLFDLDGTLIDSIELILQSARHAFLERGGRAPSDAEWLSGVGIPLATMFRRFTDDEAEAEALVERYRAFQIPNHDRLVRAYPGVAETVEALRTARHPLGIVTSKTEALARRGIDLVGIGSHFDVIIGCDTIEHHKPDPRPVLAALDRLGRPASDSVFVGDSTHDIAAGNAARVTTVAALWGPFTREQLAPAGPSHFLERITDLPTLLAAASTGAAVSSA